ncbi:MAG: asparagine synthase-related protein, partial [Vicinamibacterales bacterium]
DEVFGGYDFRYVPHALECWIRAVTARAGLSGSLRAIGGAWPRSRRLPRALRIGTFIENIGRSAADAYFSDLCITKPHDVRLAIGKTGRDPRASAVYEAATRPYLECSSASPVQRAQYADLKVYLPNDVLVKVDRMSMLNSLEIRCPLLDRRIVELGFRISTGSKMPRLRAKYLLKRIAVRTLPSDVLRLPKHGFSAPTGEWIRGEYAKQFADDVLRAGSRVGEFMDLAVVRRWTHEHSSGARDRSNTLWAIWMFERWSRCSERRAERAAPEMRQSRGADAACVVEAG